MNLQLVYQYRFNLSKNENMFKKSKTKRDQKKREKSLLLPESKPGPPTCEVNTLSIALQQLMLNKTAKLIILKIFCS